MIIGDSNHFQIASHSESISIGQRNTLGVRAKLSNSIILTDYCTIGPGCSVLLSPFINSSSSPLQLESVDSASPTSTPNRVDQMRETLPPFTVVYGIDSSRRIWSGEGKVQAHALHMKHLDFLREVLVRPASSYNKWGVLTTETAKA